jgi:hypothetical protein
LHHALWHAFFSHALWHVFYFVIAHTLSGTYILERKP